MQQQHPRVQVTYPAWARCGQFVQRLCQVDSRVVHHLTYRIVFLLPSKGQLGECSLIAWSIFYVNEMLLVRDGVILRQLKEANEGLQQRDPGGKERMAKVQCLKYLRVGCIVQGCSHYLVSLLIQPLQVLAGLLKL